MRRRREAHRRTCGGSCSSTTAESHEPAGGADGEVAFVLGGGGVLGANEVGMLRALSERDVAPDVVVGTSVGAVNGAVVAAGFDAGAVTRLAHLWTGISQDQLFAGSVLTRLRTFAQSKVSLHRNDRLRELLAAHLPAHHFEQLAVPFHCVAASIERAAAHWFTSGPLIDAVLASAAVPGLLPPVQIDGEHYYDGGLVHSIPVSRAVLLGARIVYVLQVGRIGEPLTPPRSPLQVGMVAFEIARRHRFVEEMQRLPDDVTVHVLPTGQPERPPRLSSQLRYRDFAGVQPRMERAYRASAAYLERVAR